MERRKSKRQARRVRVYFWEKGDRDRRGGYTINVSPTGMFIGTSRPLAPGAEVQVEVGYGERQFTVDGVVVHAARVSPLLQQVRPSGMGVRFDQAERELSEILKPGA